MPDLTDNEYQTEYSKLLSTATKIADVRKNIQLYKYHNYYLLAKDMIVIGHITLSEITIANNEYYHVDGIFISQQYRKSAALYWLLYGVKEVVDRPVVADGAIFKDGQDLISAIQKHKFLNAMALNKNTGQKSEVNSPINNASVCYIFESANIGFGKQLFVEGLQYTWYPLFDEI